jgi:hypothetical protein
MNPFLPVAHSMCPRSKKQTPPNMRFSVMPRRPASALRSLISFVMRGSSALLDSGAAPG